MESKEEEEKQMGTLVQPSSGDMPEVPDGLYRARVTGIKGITLDVADQFGKTEKIDITVEFTVGDEIVTLDPRVNRAWSEKATLFQIAQACGLEVDPFEPFDADELMDREVNILTEQPDGKWPRVKAWSRVKGSKASAPAQKPTEASTLPSLISATGDVDWTKFWAECGKASITKPMVAEALNGDLNKITEMEPTEVVELFGILKATAEGKADPKDIPFEP